MSRSGVGCAGGNEREESERKEVVGGVYRCAEGVRYGVVEGVVVEDVGDGSEGKMVEGSEQRV